MRLNPGYLLKSFLLLPSFQKVLIHLTDYSGNWDTCKNCKNYIEYIYSEVDMGVNNLTERGKRAKMIFINNENC